MPPKSNLVDDLIIALRDARVLSALANVFEDKLQPLLDSVSELQAENARQSSQITKLHNDLQTA